MAQKEGVYDKEIKIVLKMLQQSKTSLVKGAYNLAMNIVGRLGDDDKQRKPMIEDDESQDGKEKTNEDLKNDKNKNKDSKKDSKKDDKKDDKKAGKNDPKKKDDKKKDGEKGEEGEKEEEANPYVQRLIEQAMNPHTECLVTRQSKFIKIFLSQFLIQIIYMQSSSLLSK